LLCSLLLLLELFLCIEVCARLSLQFKLLGIVTVLRCILAAFIHFLCCIGVGSHFVHFILVHIDFLFFFFLSLQRLAAAHRCSQGAVVQAQRLQSEPATCCDGLQRRQQRLVVDERSIETSICFLVGHGCSSRSRNDKSLGGAQKKKTAAPQVHSGRATVARKRGRPSRAATLAHDVASLRAVLPACSSLCLPLAVLFGCLAR
jgi:hypothetical protein